MSQTANEGQQSGQPALPNGVQPGSAAANALDAQAAAAKTAADAAKQTGDQKPAGYVPVGELAQERQKRHELEQKVAGLEKAQSDQLSAFKQALGLSDAQQTPEQIQSAMQQTLNQQASEHKAALTQLAVHQLAAANGADPAALLDSNKFLTSIKDLAPTDTAGITKAITDAVAANKQLAATKSVSPGAGDAGQGAGGGGSKPTTSDLIRAAAGFGH